ncbi:MAG: phosphate ABC transporter substrate-binding protein, partial [Phycisphaerales bacterium]
MLLNAVSQRAGASLRRAAMLCLLSAAALAMASCERSGMTGSGTQRTGPSGQDVVRITGSSTMAPLIAELASVYEKENAGVRIDIETGGTSRGIADVRRGVADIGMVSRALSPGEADLDARTIARDGVALVVHASNPIASLSAEEVRSIFTGRVSDW